MSERIILILDRPRTGCGGYTRCWMETDLLEFQRSASKLNDYHKIVYEPGFRYPWEWEYDEDEWEEDWHGYNCVCEECVQNYPERQYLLEDIQPWEIEKDD